MTMLFHKNLSTLLFVVSHSTPKPNLIFSLHLSTTKPNRPNTKPDPTHFILHFLTTSIGFSLHQALKASAHLTCIKTPQHLHSVLDFLLSTGLTNAHIKTLISWYPRFLTADVDKTLIPISNALKHAGFDGSTLTQIIRSNPTIFRAKNAIPRLQFWQSFFHHNEKHLFSALKRNRNLVNHDIGKIIMPNIQVLETFGFSKDDVAAIIMKVNGFILRRPDTIQALIARTRELGFSPCDGGMFVQALSVVGMLKASTIEKRFELMKSFGWSEKEILDAFKKHPSFVSLSEENVRSKMGLLVGEAGYDASVIARRPSLLSYSLEGRLVPRYLVLKELKAKGLGKGDWDLGSVVMLPEDKFVKSYIFCYEEVAPYLYKYYLDVCGGKV